MSNENRRKPADCGVTGGSHARPNIQDLSNSELLNEVIELVEGQSAEDMDVDAIMERLALLQERAPVPMDHAPGDILADLEKQHPLILKSWMPWELRIPLLPRRSARRNLQSHGGRDGAACSTMSPACLRPVSAWS